MFSLGQHYRVSLCLRLCGLEALMTRGISCASACHLSELGVRKLMLLFMEQLGIIRLAGIHDAGLSYLKLFLLHKALGFIM